MELFRALGVLAEPPTCHLAHLAEALELGPLPDEAEYTDLFLLQLYPYASVYLGQEGMLGGEARDRVAGFWRALGETPPPEPDHLSLLLAFYARLAEFERSGPSTPGRAGWARARRAFLWEHLLSWLPVYLNKLIRLAPPFYRRWGEVLNAALRDEALSVGRQESLPVSLRESSGVADPRAGGFDGFLQSLLAPVRSGIILTRADLNRAARRLGLGLRLAERQFVLRSLFGQDAEGMLRWLREEAAAWVDAHPRDSDTLEEVARAWRERAVRTATLLEELARSPAQWRADD